MYTENLLENKIKDFKKSVVFSVCIAAFVVFGLFPWIVGWARIVSWFVK